MSTDPPASLFSLIDPSFADPVERHIARNLLQLAHSEWTESATFDLDDPALLPLLTRHRLITHLSSSYLPASQHRTLRKLKTRVAGEQLQVEAVARFVLSEFSAEGINARVLKGLASGALDYPDRGLRQVGDVDLLVPAAKIAHAAALLRARGFTTLGADGSPRSKGLVALSPSGVEVDLHTRLFRRSPRQRLDLFATTEPLDVFSAHALDADARLVHAAAHFLLGPPGLRRMSGLVDVVMMRNHASFDQDAALHIACSLGVAAHVRTVLELEEQLVNRLDRLDLSEWPKLGALDRASLLTDRRRLPLEHVVRLREVRGLDRVRYLPAWLTPSHSQRQKLRRSLHSPAKRSSPSAFRGAPKPHEEAPRRGPTLIYIAGYGRSGSTALEQALAHELGALPLGELCNLFTSDQRYGNCRCGVRTSECPFWAPKIALAAARSGSSVAELASLTKRVESWRGVSTEAEVADYQVAWDSVFRSLAEDQPDAVLIDGSKSAHGRARFLRLLDLDLFASITVVHLRRPVSGVMESFAKGLNVELRTGETPSSNVILRNLRSLRGAAGWVRTERRTKVLLGRKEAESLQSVEISTSSYREDDWRSLTTAHRSPVERTAFFHTIDGNRLLQTAPEEAHEFRPRVDSPASLSWPMRAVAHSATKLAGGSENQQ